MSFLRGGPARLGSFLAREARATGLPVRSLVLAAAAWHLAVLLQTPNPWHADEHFQILEFAWARAELAPVEALPWEWEARIRPTLQPAMALGALQGLRALGLAGPGFPELWILLLRAGTLVAALAVLMAVVARVSPTLPRGGRRALWLTALGIWFAPLFLSRFSSENLSGLALASALVVATGSCWGGGGGACSGGGEADVEGTTAAPGDGPDARARRELAVGALLGLAFLFRYQTAFAGLALLLWLALGRPGSPRPPAEETGPGRPPGGPEGLLPGWRGTLRASAAGAVVVALGLCVDRWFYGEWVLAPWRYLHANLVEGVAASFGTSPWWAYLVEMPLWMAPPLGLVVAVLVLAGIASRPGSPWGWCFAAFLVGHSMVAHKEMRFLLPLLYLLPPLVAVGWTEAVQRRLPAPWRRGLAWGLVLQNAILALFLLTPSIHRGKDMDVHYFRFLAERAETHPGDTVRVLSRRGRPWQVWDLDARVWAHPRAVGVEHAPGDSLPPSLARGAAPERLLLLARTPEPPRVAGARLRGPVYRAEPGYRAVARWMGLEDTAALRWLEEVDGWRTSPWVRRVWEVVPQGRAGP